eukprot:SAG11_NODE_170_length_13624_cov_40.078226_10_plen_33_part_00
MEEAYSDQQESPHAEPILLPKQTLVQLQGLVK